MTLSALTIRFDQPGSRCRALPGGRPLAWPGRWATGNWDALAVCAAFNTTGRLADAFGFEVLTPEGFAAGAKYLLKRGYR